LTGLVKESNITNGQGYERFDISPLCLKREEEMPFRFGPWEIALILVIILLVFGVGKLPQVGSAIGKGLRAFRKGQSGEALEEGEEEPKGKVTKKAAKVETKRRGVS
jgi:sec-independent protein translocase protein TatA